MKHGKRKGTSWLEDRIPGRKIIPLFDCSCIQTVILQRYLRSLARNDIKQPNSRVQYVGTPFQTFMELGISCQLCQLRLERCFGALAMCIIVVLITVTCYGTTDKNTVVGDWALTSPPRCTCELQF